MDLFRFSYPQFSYLILSLSKSVYDLIQAHAEQLFRDWI